MAAMVSADEASGAAPDGRGMDGFSVGAGEGGGKALEPRFALREVLVAWLAGLLAITFSGHLFGLRHCPLAQLCNNVLGNILAACFSHLKGNDAPSPHHSLCASPFLAARFLFPCL